MEKSKSAWLATIFWNAESDLTFKLPQWQPLILVRLHESNEQRHPLTMMWASNLRS